MHDKKQHEDSNEQQQNCYLGLLEIDIFAKIRKPESGLVVKSEDVRADGI